MLGATVNHVRRKKCWARMLGASHSKRKCLFFSFQLPMVVAQVTATKLKTHQELRYTTAAGAVIQLMGSDEQFSLVEFPIVLAYNRIHHYLPTAYLSDRSLANWRLAQMYKHFTAANEYFVESKLAMEYEPELVQALDAIFVGVTEVQRQVRDRAKLGSTAATSVPISLTGKKPKRSDILGRMSGLPKRDCRLIPLPQPIFDNPAEDPSLPDYIFERRAATSTVTTEASSIEGEPGPSVTTTAGQATPSAPVTTTAGQATPSAPVTTTAGQATPSAPVTSTLTSGATTSSTSSDTTPACEGVRPPPASAPGTQIPGSQSGRHKRKASKPAIIEEGGVDDIDRDPDFVVQDEDLQEPEVQPSSSILSGLSQEQSLQKGIPQLPKKRAVVPESKKKYRCQVCNQGFQRTSELKDHNYTQHLGGSYSCAECLKSYVNEKGLKYHIKSIHKGEARCKCTEEGCTWEDKDSGKLHQHLLTAHEIGDPLVCQVILEDGSTCKKVFKNTRSFKTHAAFHLEKKFKCHLCDRHFSTETNRKVHIARYHRSQDDETRYQCEHCGKTFDMESQLNNHRNLHRLQHHRMLQAQKKEEAAKKAKEEAGEQGEPSSSTSQPSSQAQPELSQPPLPQIPNPQPPVSLPVSLNLPAHLTAQSTQMFEGQIVIGSAIKQLKEEEEEMEVAEADD